MTETDMKELFRVMQAIYPSSELFQGNLSDRVKIWCGFFRDIEPRRMKRALMRYATNNRFAPTISDFMTELKTDYEVSAIDEWNTLMQIAERINDYRDDFAYTYIPEGKTKSQGEEAREAALRCYETAPTFIHDYIGGYSSMLRFAREIEALDQKGISIKRRDFENWRKNKIESSTLHELRDPLGESGLNRRVIGYNGYTPILEGDAPNG